MKTGHTVSQCFLKSEGKAWPKGTLDFVWAELSLVGRLPPLKMSVSQANTLLIYLP